jgi:hypothetical protein
MIPLDKLRSVKTIITHDSCPDGTMSALLLKDAYAQAGLEVEIKFVQYGTQAYKTLTPTPNMMFCDFSPFVPEEFIDPKNPLLGKKLDQEKLKPWLESDAIILDHHKGAKLFVQALGEERCEFGDEVEHPGVAGAMLAYRHVWLPFYANTTKAAWAEKSGQKPILQPAKTVEELAAEMGSPVEDAHDRVVRIHETEHARAREAALLAGIRDTWQNKSEHWDAGNELAEVLRLFPNEDWLAQSRPFHPDSDAWWNQRMKLGKMLWAKHMKRVRENVDNAWRFTSIAGTRVVVFPGVHLSSDAAEVVDTSADLIMAFDYDAEVPKTGGAPIRKIIYSTRSHTTFDCMNLAKGFGGGGHTKAAGFNVEFGVGAKDEELSAYVQRRDPYALAEVLVGLHEKKQQT